MRTSGRIIFCLNFNESDDVAEDEEGEVDENYESKNESSVKNFREAIVSLRHFFKIEVIMTFLRVLAMQ